MIEIPVELRLYALVHNRFQLHSLLQPIPGIRTVLYFLQMHFYVRDRAGLGYLLLFYIEFECLSLKFDLQVMGNYGQNIDWGVSQ